MPWQKVGFDRCIREKFYLIIQWLNNRPVKLILTYCRFWVVWMNNRLHTIRRPLIQMCRLKVFFWLFYCTWRTSYVWSPWEGAFQ